MQTGTGFDHRIAAPLAALLLLAAGGSALAADIALKAPPPAAVYNWSGFYIGINGGRATGYSNWNDGLLGSSGTFETYGFVGGGTIGVNYQSGPFVYGIEGDGDWSSLKGSFGPNCGALTALLPASATCVTQNTWLATARGRAGYAFGSVLLYGTAGGAFGDIQAAVSPGAFDTSTKVGWTAGAGVEVFFAPNWTAKVDYLFVDLSQGSCASVANCGGAAGSAVTYNESLVRAGINYKFGW
jgi:outer membrane immunogenic protein